MWGYLLMYKITNTSRYLTGVLNVEEDREFSNLNDSNK